MRKLLLVMVAVSLLPGCLNNVFPSGEEMQALRYQLEVYAAAAREFQYRTGSWPGTLEDLASVSRAFPSHQTYPMQIGSLSPRGDGTLTLVFSADRVMGSRTLPWPFRGEVVVQRQEVEDGPAATIRWKRGVPPVLGSSGTIRMASRALGEYADSDVGES